MPHDLIIRGGTLVTPGGLVQADVAVQDGVIANIEPEPTGAASEELDASGLHVFPGLIDAHVHFNEPGRTHWEGFATGSAALAAGGGTLFFDMPLNSSPPVLDRESFLAKKTAAEASSLTDFALWGGLTPENLERLPDLAELGVVGFKAFMSDSGLDDFKAADDLTLFEGMAMAAQLSLPVAVHAESEALTRGFTEKIRAVGGRGVRDYLATRPVVAELEAIGRALLFAEATGADLHIVHVSTARGVALVADAKDRGVRVSCETCPHYLHFTDEDMMRLGAVVKCAPPLRSDNERAALWEAVLRGEVDFIASDHSPSPPDLKEKEDFFEVWGGIAGVQSTLNVLLTDRFAHGLPLQTIARLTATAPAERFGIAGKGRLEPGFDADLTLVDLARTHTLSADDLLSRHKLSPYIGETFRGRVRRTLVRGRTVFADGKVTNHRGRFLRPQERKP